MTKTKYVLVNKIVTTQRVAEDMMRRGAAQAFEPVTLDRIKTERIHVYREEDYFRHVEEDDFQRDWHDKFVAAKIVHFDRSSGEGLCHVEGFSHLLPIYACNLPGRRTWYPSTACVYYEEGQTVEVQLKVFHGFTVFVNGVTPAKFDAEAWDKIKDKDLAFRCDESGRAVTGLFK